MGVVKEMIMEGNGADKPHKGDNVTIEYTGWLLDRSKPDSKGTQ